jgi:hypothetical protein
MAALRDQERSELLRQCLSKTFFLHGCEDGYHVPCGACEQAERLQRMSTKELADELARLVERPANPPDGLTAEQLRQRFVERFGE